MWCQCEQHCLEFIQACCPSEKKFELPGTKCKTSTGFEPMTSGPIITNADLTVKTTRKFERVNYVSKNCNSALDIILVFKTN